MNFIVDSLNTKEPNKASNKISKWKLIFLVGFVVFLFLSFLITAFNLQILNSKNYKTLANNNFKKSTYILPQRGIIYSSNNTPLVQNKPVFALSVDLNYYNRFKEYKNISEIFPPNVLLFLRSNKVAFTNEDLQSFNNALKLGKEYYTLLKFYETDQYIYLSSKLSELQTNSSLKVISLSYRDYKNPYEFAHLLGYTQAVDEKTITNDPWYTPDSTLGVFGLEAYYERQLRGTKGEQVKTYNAKSAVESTKVIKEPIAGNSLITSINKELQVVAYNSLKEKVNEVGAIGGSVVVQNPNNGEVLALVNYPSFDINEFSKGINNNSYQQLINNKKRPLLNRSISSAFPPASTFKILMVAAGLEEGSLSRETTINDTGVININNFTYKTWKAGGHGLINVIGALKESSDIFFYVLGGGHSDYPQIKGLGVDAIQSWSNKFGFGKALGIDLYGETGGFVPSQSWKQQQIGEPWYIGNTYHFSIGQGFLTSTPLQVNAMVNAVANGGIIYKPQIVKTIIDSNNNVVKNYDPVVVSNLNLSENTLNVLKQGLIEATSPGGTAYPLFNYKVQVAGKTGTAEFGIKKPNGDYPTHAWYTAYAPANNPQISVTVFVEDGGGGSDVAAPIAKAVFDEYFKNINESN